MVPVVKNAFVIKINSSCLINFINSDLVLLELLSETILGSITTILMCALFWFNAILFFFSENSKQYFWSSHSSQHERTKLVLQLYLASVCPVAREASRVTGTSEALRPQQVTGKEIGRPCPAACAAGFLNQPAPNHDQAAPQKQNPVMSIWAREGSTCQLTQLSSHCPQPRAPGTSQGEGSGLSPKLSTTHWHKGQECQRQWVYSPPKCHFKAAACRLCPPAATWMQWRRKIKGLWSCGERAKEEGNLKDSILEAYVLESLQPVPCQKNIGQVGWSDLRQPQMVSASLLRSLLWAARNKGCQALWCSYSAT